MYRKSKRKQQTEPSAKLLNDVIEPVTFARSAGSGGGGGGDICTIHTNIYIYSPLLGGC